MSLPQELAVDALTKDEVQALKSLYRGEADAYQQRLALQVIVNKFSRAQDLLYIPGDTHASAFLQGRSFVGSQIFKHLKLPLRLLTSEGDKNADATTDRTPSDE